MTVRRIGRVVENALIEKIIRGDTQASLNCTTTAFSVADMQDDFQFRPNPMSNQPIRYRHLP